MRMYHLRIVSQWSLLSSKRNFCRSMILRVFSETLRKIGMKLDFCIFFARNNDSSTFIFVFEAPASRYKSKFCRIQLTFFKSFSQRNFTKTLTFIFSYPCSRLYCTYFHTERTQQASTSPLHPKTGSIHALERSHYPKNFCKIKNQKNL